MSRNKNQGVRNKFSLQGLRLIWAIAGSTLIGLAAAGTHSTHDHPRKTHPKRHQQGRTKAHVEYTYLGTSTLDAYRQDDECLAPLTMLEGWGWKVTNLANGRVKLDVDDQSVEVTLRQAEGEDCVFLREAIRLLDGNSVWATPDHLQITGRVRVVRFVGHHLKVSASLAITPQVTQPGTNGLSHVDLSGATLSPDAIIDVEPNVAIKTVSPTHVAIDFPVASRYLVPAEEVQPTKELDLDSSLAIAIAPTDSVLLSPESDKGLTIDLGTSQHLTGPVHVTRLDATTLKLSLPGVQMSESPNLSQTPSVLSITPTASAKGTDLVVQVKRPMGASVTQTGGRLRLTLVKPPVGDGKIAGKLIVVDAGHGGKDTGATHPYSGLQEKELTLIVAKRLAADLAAEGATVILTRDTDDFVSLDERANIANRNHADLFLCVHINSNGNDRKTSGTITFFHGQDAISATLADCIQREIVKVSGIPGIGCWSDQKIYRTGFSVLRNTKMPGVLMELGFINNDHDRTMLVRDDIDSAIAAAIVQGVKTYLGAPPTAPPAKPPVVTPPTGSPLVPPTTQPTQEPDDPLGPGHISGYNNPLTTGDNNDAS